MAQKKLEKGSVWEKADTNGDGTIAIVKLSLEKNDKA